MKQIPLLGTLILSTAVALTSCFPWTSPERDAANKACRAWLSKGLELWGPTTGTVYARLCAEDKEAKQFLGKESSAVLDGTFDLETIEVDEWKTIKRFPY